jgi:hypothetical protein
LASEKERYNRSINLLIAENKPTSRAVNIDDVCKMRKIFKTGLNQDVIDYFIFQVNSIDMLKLFVQYRGDIHKLGPPGCPNPSSLLMFLSSKEYRDVKFLKLIRFIINERVDLNVVDKEGNTAFSLCAQNGDSCDYLVERGALPPCLEEVAGRVEDFERVSGPRTYTL